MIKRLSCILFTILLTKGAMGQAPPWQWAKDANSIDPETVWEVAHDNLSDNIYAGGSFKGNLSTKYGASFATTTGNTDAFLAKYDPAGNVLWAIKIAGSNNDEEIHGVAVDPAGDVYVSGVFNSSNTDFDPSASNFTLATSGNDDGFLAKYSSAGAFLWAVKFGGNNDEQSWKMSVDANGVYLTGSYLSPSATFYSYGSPITKVTTAPDPMEDMFGAKYNSSGIAQWVISGGGPKIDIGFNVIADATNVYYIGRYDATMTFRNAVGTQGAPLQEQQNNKPQVFILAVTQAGNLAWQTNITSSSGNQVVGWSIAQDASNLYVTGYMDGNINFKHPTPTLTQNLTNNLDLYVAKLTKTGTFTWNTAATGNGNGDQIGRAIEVDYLGNIVLGGNYTSGLNYTSVGGPNFTAASQDVFITSYSNTGSFLWSTKGGGPNVDNINGISVDNTGDTYVGGDHGGFAAFGSTVLGNGGGTDIFVAKLACPTLSNNTITASQTICAGNAPSALAGSLPTGGFNYTWQMSANSVTWTTASGTFTNQNYSPPPLTATTYYRRNITAGGYCTSVLSSNVVTITAQQPPSASNAGSSQTVCASTATLSANTPTSGSGLWSVITGTGNVTSVSNPSSQVTGLSIGSNSFAWSITNGVCPSSSSTVTIIRNALPNSNAGSTQTICSATATLAAITPSAGTGVWSVTSGTATITAVNNPSSAVTAIATGTNIFMWTVTNGVCTAATSTVSIVRDVMPTANAGANQTVCTSSATLAAINPTIGSGIWSVITGTATVTSVSTPSSAVTGLNTGANAFVWTVTNGVCPAVTSTVNILRNIAPTANAGSTQTICSGNATLNATTPTVGTGVWSLQSGTATIVSSGSPSSAVNSVATGTNTFLWTVTNGVCPAATSTVNIIRDIMPTANAGSNQTVCTSVATLAAINPTIGSGIWSVITGTSNVTSFTNPSSGVTGLNTGINSFVWTVTNGVCPATTSTVNIFRDIVPTANAGSTQNICSGSATLSATTPSTGTGVWSLQSGTANIVSSGNPSSALNSIATGTNTFLWTVTNGVCPAATSTVNITRDIMPTANAGSNQTICTSNCTLAAITPTIGTGAWSVITGTATVNAFNNPASAVSAISSGTTDFLWTVTNGVCPAATSTVTIIKNVTPVSNAGADQTICASNATLSATTPTTGTGSWSLINGAATITSLNTASSTVTSIATGTNSFVWTVNDGICPAVTSTVNIIRDALPDNANAGSNFTVCTSNCFIAANSPSVGTGNWSVFTGSSTINSPTTNNSTVSNLNSGVNEFVWTISNGVCPSSTATVQVYAETPLPPAVAGPDQHLCSTTCTLSSNNPSANGSWLTFAGTGAISSNTAATTNASNLSVGNNIFVWTLSKPYCPSTSDTLVVLVDANPSVANAGTDQVICGPLSTLSANAPVVGTGNWQAFSGGASFASNNTPQTSVSNLTGGSNMLIWAISNGLCPTSYDTVVINSDLVPSDAVAGNDKMVCGDSTTIASIMPTIGTGSWSIVSGNCSISTNSINTIQITMPAPGPYVLRWTVKNGVCPDKTDDMQITRYDPPSAANAGLDQTLETSAAKLNAVAPTTGTGSWSVLSGNAEFLDVHDPQTTVNKLGVGNNVIRWTTSNGNCRENTDDILIYVKPLVIPNGFSPNGDGFNDKFVITSLEYYEQVKFSVFNRWGALLYNNNDYKNDWAGTNANNEKLADDTYYYSLEIPGFKNFTGFIVVKQNR